MSNPASAPPSPPLFASYVAIGDSFTEGVGDELADGTVRGWADLVALSLAFASTAPVRYANLAIRGRLLAPIVGGQLDAALAMTPELVSINGGGNDIMRPRVSIAQVADSLERAVDLAVDRGSHVVLASGANPTKHIPLGAFVEGRGERLAEAIRSRLPKDHVTFVDNWADAELAEAPFWSRDRLHLGPAGHARVASNVLAALGVPVAATPTASTGAQSPAGSAEPDAPRQRTAAYWREYVLPWIGRRVTGRSSGDDREPKIATLSPVDVSERR
ncbi:SGNH/GDSL hydrolase family protein [Marisediminicola sp. LYQ85]|uniref:SGNH/GDSL hydrolase family protein n=1 Tax=Marisediminicola sp. LYQ85 TaxID=3391062 RepID=UPI0039835699